MVMIALAAIGLAAMLPLPRHLSAARHLSAPRTVRSLPLMGDGRRQGRVAQVVRKELAEVIHTGDIRGKRLETAIREMISIVDVDVSPDLRNARVKVSILGDRKDKISAVRWLQASRGGIRYCMGKRMKEFKRLPEIKFEHVDVGQAVDVMILIDKLAAGRKDEDSAEDELDFDADDEEAFAEYDPFDGEEDGDEEDWDDFEDEDFEDEDEDEEALAESDAK
jgi:ribosome-binding factor A